MVQVSYPGVYVQEQPSGVRTITGVATSITAFCGRTLKGPINKPRRCLSYADFVRTFGGSPAASELALSVQQFFNNGGTDCYVVRIAKLTNVPPGQVASRAGVDLRNFAAAPAPVLRATARMEGAWGNGLRLQVDYDTPNPGETFNLRVIHEEGGREVARENHLALSMDPASPRFAPTFVTQSSQLIDLASLVANPDVGSFAGYSTALRPLGTTAAAVRTTLQTLITAASPRRAFEVSVDNSPFMPVNLEGWVVPAALADIATELAQRINTALAPLVPPPNVSVALDAVASAGGERFLTIRSAPLAASPTNGINVRVRRAASHDLAGALLLGAESGGIELARRSNFRPAPTGTILRIDDAAGSIANLFILSGLPQPGLASIRFDTDPVIDFNNAYSLETVPAPPAVRRWFLDAVPGQSPSDHRDGLREKLRRVAAAISSHAQSRYTAQLQGYQLVLTPRQGTADQRPGTITLAGDAAAVAAVTPLFVPNVRQYVLGRDQTGASPYVAFNAATQTGGDGDAPGYADFVGDPAAQSGFHALDPVDLFNLMVIPADADVPEADRNALWAPASVYCQSRRAFLIVESPVTNWTADGRAIVVNDAATLAGTLRTGLVTDHSAVFYPRIQVKDAGLVRTIGPGGAVAGLMARTDGTRGVWKAPAGTEADLRTLSGLEVKLTDLENGVLNKLGVNCLRHFPTGIVNWGARTLDGADDFGSEWKYIPIRRLALFLAESLYRGTQWAVFEPNDEPLWARLRLNIGVFLNGLFRQGAFQGLTPDQAYYVKCDADTTTQADRNFGIVNIEVGFAPLKPAEFVVITIRQIAGELTT